LSAVAKPEAFGDLGPAMRELNERQRAFVRAYVVHPPGLGALVNSYVAAGYGTPESNRSTLAKNAHHLSCDEKVIAAIAEESKKLLKVAHPQAVNALLSLIGNPDHKDHARALAMLLDRADPLQTSHNISVTHKVVSADEEAIEELRAARALGASRERLLELFGENELPRIERLESAKAAQAKLVTGKVIDHE
jgi:phage terminase small subunit